MARETGSHGNATRQMQKLNQIPHSFWLKPIVTNKNGAQDSFGDIRGYAVYIEFKKDDDTEPRKLQKYRIYKANQRGALSFWSGSWQTTERYLLEFARDRGFSLYDRNR